MKSLFLAAMAAGALLSGPAFAQQYGAVAISTSGPRAWGAQSKINDPTIALQDALDDCNKHYLRKGGRGSCKGEATMGWAAAITCGTRGHVTLHAWVNDRQTAAEAATDALARITSKGPAQCQFQVLAHGSVSGKTDVRGRQWTAEVVCEGRNASATLLGAAPALNAALAKVRGNATCNRCQVISLAMH